MVRLLRARGVSDEEVLRAFATVDRGLFVAGPDPYADRAQPTALGQTVSQPFVAALMTQAARPESGYRGAHVLEVGTGSGYQAAILAELGASVTSIERHGGLAARAAANLERAGVAGAVEVRVGDGTLGCPDRAPFDAILVTAAAPTIPPPLVDQLQDDSGRLVAPLGPPTGQHLVVLTRSAGRDRLTRLCPVVFVPLRGAFGVEDSCARGRHR